MVKFVAIGSPKLTQWPYLAKNMRISAILFVLEVPCAATFCKYFLFNWNPFCYAFHQCIVCIAFFNIWRIKCLRILTKNLESVQKVLTRLFWAIFKSFFCVYNWKKLCKLYIGEKHIKRGFNCTKNIYKMLQHTEMPAQTKWRKFAYF